MPALLLLFFAAMAWAHAPVIPLVRAPLRVDGARILDSTGAVVQLRGAVLPDAEAATAVTLGAMRIRWNFNAVRIPVRTASWQREGRPYLERVAAAVDRARDADLIAILAPDAPATGFWPEWAGRFRDVPNVVFSIYRTGQPQPAYDAIRSASARQIVAVPVEAVIRGENIIAEIRPSLAAPLPPRTVPMYAGEFDISDCSALPFDPRKVSALVYESLFEFDFRGVSWTVSTFAAGSLLRDTVEYLPTSFGPGWTCGDPGIGEVVLTWTTGDPGGFGFLRKEAIANAAGGPASPASPGQILSLYIEQMGPAPDRLAALDAAGRLPFELGGTEVFFDGQRVPVQFTSQHQINVQVPHNLAPGRDAVVQVFYRGVPSNRPTLPIVAAAPEIFHDAFTKNAIALNQNGTRNGAASPAAPGSVVVLFATGTGVTSPPGSPGVRAPSPHPLLTLPAALRVDGQEAEVLFAGEVPGFIGLSQINARIPGELRTGSLPVMLRVGDSDSQAPVVLAVR